MTHLMKINFKTSQNYTINNVHDKTTRFWLAENDWILM